MSAQLFASSTTRRGLYAAASVTLLAATVFEASKHSTGFWQIAVFAIGPDLTLLFGGGGDLERGQLHPRAVPAYNLVHRFWGPVLLACLSALPGVPTGYLIGALTWALHIAVDRALGYGLRTADGFQRQSG
jgi:uncharacterized protein DUF4260